MDFHVEKQIKEQLRGGDLNKFILLYDDVFSDVYSYLYRRVLDVEKAEELTRLVFLDALNRAKDVPLEVGFKVWVFSLAKDRVFRFFDRNGFPENQGVIGKEELTALESNRELLKRFAGLMEKLSMQEKEILRLKFFEELSDGEVAYILEEDEDLISGKVLRVLKRVYLLFFGQASSQDNYYAELSGEMSKVRAMELIEVPEVLRLKLRADMSGRIVRQDFAIEVESEINEEPVAAFEEATGSDDPAKIFVEAVNEMREEERRDQEKRERFESFIDRFRGWLIFVPVLIFVLLLGVVFMEFFDFSKPIARGDGSSEICADVEFDGDFNDTEKRSVNAGVSSRICDRFDADRLVVYRNSRENVDVDVEIGGDLLQYNFKQPLSRWKVYSYEKKTAISRN